MNDLSKIRVLHINTAKTWRGGERQVFNLALELKARGIAQIVIAKTDSELAKRCRANDVDVEELALRGEWDVFSAKALAKIAKDFDANILHAHTARAHSIALLARRQLEGVVLLVSRRVDFPMRLNFLSKRKYMHPLVNGYLAISKNVKNVLIKDGIDENKIDIAYSGIDLSLWDSVRDPIALRSEFMIHPDTLCVGNVAALVDHKDHMTFLEAIHFLVSDLEEDEEELSYKVFLLGDGELRASLEKKAKELGVLYPDGPVVFCGYREDIYDFYYLFDIFALSSKEEGLGTAVLDAMAAGLPVVATSAGGIPEMIVPQKGGFLSDVGDAKGFAVNLKKMLRSSDLRKNYANFNKKEVLMFGHHNTAESTIEVYQKYLEGLV